MPIELVSFQLVKWLWGSVDATVHSNWADMLFTLGNLVQEITSNLQRHDEEGLMTQWLMAGVLSILSSMIFTNGGPNCSKALSCVATTKVAVKIKIMHQGPSTKYDRKHICNFSESAPYIARDMKLFSLSFAIKLFKKF